MVETAKNWDASDIAAADLRPVPQSRSVSETFETSLALRVNRFSAGSCKYLPHKTNPKYFKVFFVEMAFLDLVLSDLELCLLRFNFLSSQKV